MLLTKAFMKKENEIQEAKNKTLVEELKVTVPSVIPIQSSMQNDPSSSSLSDSSGSSEHSGILVIENIIVLKLGPFLLEYYPHSIHS